MAEELETFDAKNELIALCILQRARVKRSIELENQVGFSFELVSLDIRTYANMLVKLNGPV